MIYAAVVTGWVWMTSWQAAQTTRVLRRLVAMSAAHGGWPDPGSQAGELADLVHQHLARFAAQLTPPGQESVDQLLAGVGGRWGDAVAQDRVLVAHEGNPAEPGYQVRLAVAVDPGLEAGPQPVPGFDLGLVLGGHLRHGGLVLGGEGLQHRRLGVPAQIA